MAKGLITRAYLEDTADAIRVLRGESDTYIPDEFGEKILDAIPDVTVTDDIVSVTDAAAYPAEGLEFAIEPVQDLHGYDKPWPAGGGKNLVDININTSVSSGSITFDNPVGETVTISAKKNSVVLSDAVWILDVLMRDNTHYYVGDTGYTWPFPQTVNATAQNPITKITWRNYGLTSGSYDIQMELGSTATSYEPYANICPISGWTGVNGERAGVNVWDEEWMAYSINQIRSKNPLYVGSDTSYYIKAPVPLAIDYYDANDNLISTVYKNNTTITTPNNCAYIKFITTTGYGSNTYNNDIAINYPSSVTTFEPYTGTSIPVTFPALGKNLFNVSKQPSYTNGASSIVNNNDGTLTINLGGITSIGNVKLRDLIGDGLIGQTCFLSAQTTGVNKFIYLSGENIPWGFNTSKTITTEMLDSTVLWYASGANTSATISDIQLELGNQATSYEPYTNTVYGGRVDVVNGKLTADRAEVDLGDLSWSKSSPDKSIFLSSPLPNMKPAQGVVDVNDKSKICSNYKYIGIRYESSLHNGEFITSLSAGTIRIQDDNYTNATVFKTAMQGVQLVYELAAPIEYDITPQQVQMLLGDNNIWCDTGNTTLEYKVDLSRYIAKLQAAQATPQLSLSRQAVSLGVAMDETTQNEDEEGGLR